LPCKVSLIIIILAVAVGNDYELPQVNSSNLSSVVSSFTIPVPIINDNISEENETFLAQISISPTAGGPMVTLNPSMARITINDDDSKYIPQTKVPLYCPRENTNLF